MAGKKGKQKGNKVNGDNISSKTAHLSGDVKRSIVAVFLFVIALISVLGFAGNAGILGKYLNIFFGSIFGWGKWVSPLVLIGIGIVLLFRKSLAFYLTKILGMFFAFMAVLGFFHIFYPAGKMAKIAAAGEGGGYLGYFIAAGMLKLGGMIAGFIILLALFITGIIVAFNFSLASLFRKEEEPVADNLPEEETEEIQDEPAELEDAKEENKPEEVLDEKHNIKSIQFEGQKKDLHPEPIEGAETSPKTGWLSREKKDNFIRRPINHSSNGWILPPYDILENSKDIPKGGDVERNAQTIQKTLGDFGIEVELGGILTGPTVTQYSFRPAVGVKLSKITALSNDLALALAAPSIRIEAPIPGKSLVGIEIPNKNKAVVRMRKFLESEEFQNRKSNLSIILGEDVSGNCIIGNLEKMPHLMIAGSTGSGKSVCINSILISLLYQNSPDDLRLILVDPKRVELSLYNGIPHLLTDNVIVENSKVVQVLRWAIGEMERRYRLLQDAASKDIFSYNQKVAQGMSRHFTDPETNEEQEEKYKKLPFIVIVIDELADLMQSHGKEVESSIVRIAQMARAVGIHLVVSTQRPSVETITGLIKANISSRIAFMVASQIDSRTIIDSSGAEKLVGNGDMLYVSANNSTKPKRLQAVFISEDEVKKVIKFIKNQKTDNPDYVEDLPDGPVMNNSPEEKINTASNPATASGKIDLDILSANEQDDPLYEEAKNIVVQSKRASTSLLQRRLRVGYARAARLMDILEERGIIGSSDGTNKPREILVPVEMRGNSKPEYEDSVEDQEKRDKWQM
jgi:DNA segregation ATPase FtsK/SpoIIIE, S-DNA-T family